MSTEMGEVQLVIEDVVQTYLADDRLTRVLED
jgi:hypothetical protein